MSGLDWREPLALLRTGFETDDWIAVFMKSYASGATAQRIVPIALATTPRFMAWLRWRNTSQWEIYCSTNAIEPEQRSRTRRAIRAVRHVFVEADRDGQSFLAAVARRTDVPPPSYILRTSPDHVHVLWRVRGFGVEQVEHMQKHLARELGGDTAATAASQTTRLPGFFNHKRDVPFRITLVCGATADVFEPSDFPSPRQLTPARKPLVQVGGVQSDIVDRARAYLQAIPPAIEGQRGDAHTFRVCCRLVRGFALDDAQALVLLSEWNARCAPPWTDRDLVEKLRHARQYGREPIGGLLATSQVDTLAST